MNNILNNIDFTDRLALLRWADGSSGYVYLKNLRLACPCAFCSGESGVFGPVSFPAKKDFSLSSCDLKSFSFVGLYGVRFVWGDGHSDGIFTFNYLKALCKSEQK